jgi:hypothetical protein
VLFVAKRAEEREDSRARNRILGGRAMYTVQYKATSAQQAWQTVGSYGSEQTALSNAERASHKYFMVRVLDPDKSVIWSH